MLDVTKPFIISKQSVMKAYKLIKANAGAAGIDEQSITDFEEDLKNNLYKLWNRLSSGCYFPPPVKAVPIPKKSGGKRILGIPTVSDRIAQMVVKLEFEPCVEPYFHKDSYGYRPKKSALDAIGVTRERCWKYDFVLEYDIKGLFDNIDHELLMKAICKHTSNKWVILYIKRWLKVPMQLRNGELQERTKGVPQGGVISPVLSNLFLHYVFDTWMTRDYAHIPWCRYADDGLLHCKTLPQAKYMLERLKERMQKCGLEIHPEKTKIVYCKDERRNKKYSYHSFEFLGYEFQTRTAKNEKDKCLFNSFLPAVSKTAKKSMRKRIREYRLNRKTDISMKDIANYFNPILRGWIEYYGKYYHTALEPVFWYFNKRLQAWMMRKYKKLRGRTIWTRKILSKIYEQKPYLFEHWKNGMKGSFV